MEGNNFVNLLVAESLLFSYELIIPNPILNLVEKKRNF